MKKIAGYLVALVLLLSMSAGPAAESKPASTPSKSAPGIEAAQAISMITGVAISPLLGVSGIGCWKYWRTAADKRAALPWFAKPWFWIPGLLLVVVVFVKDVSGTALPTALKKPFDVAEVFENKLSALIAAGLFIPLIASVVGDVGGDEASFFRAAGLATLDATSLLNIITIPLALGAFFVVWMVSHVINVLILISPFGTVDAVLKSARLFLLSTVAASAMANPYMGALISLVIILCCWLLSGWAMRLMVFGNIFAWDLLTLRHRRSNPVRPESRVFTARKIEKIPVRTCGRLRRDEQGRLVLDYRPWLVLPRRTLTLPEGEYVVGRGLMNPEVMRVTNGEARTMLTLPPRFVTHEEEFSNAYQMSGVLDAGMIKGFKSLWSWMKGLFVATPRVAPA